MDAMKYSRIEQYMLEMMGDSAHDPLHIYRVLRQSLVIAKAYAEIDTDVLVAAALLHDIGRDVQFADPSLCHAAEGGKMAAVFLKSLGWDESRCLHVHDCIKTHRYRAESPPVTIEAKIIYDSDKLDAVGAIGIARTLIYGGQVGEPLYTVDENGTIHNSGDESCPESFLKEYHYKLITLYYKFYTPEATAIALERKKTAVSFYKGLLEEISHNDLKNLLGF